MSNDTYSEILSKWSYSPMMFILLRLYFETITKLTNFFYLNERKPEVLLTCNFIEHLLSNAIDARALNFLVKVRSIDASALES